MGRSIRPFSPCGGSTPSISPRTGPIRKAHPGEARRSVGDGGSRRSACERGPRRPRPAGRGHYPQRHRPGLRDRPRRGQAAHGGAIEDARQHGRDSCASAEGQKATPWRVGLADPDTPGAITETIDLVDRAVATTAGAGFRFDPAGRFTHLFDPATGRSPALYRTVSVIAPTATEADALSTAFSLMPLSRISDIAASRPGVQARLVTAGGDLLVYGT